MDKKSLKLSRYNDLFRIKNSYYLVNFLSGNVVKLEEKSYRKMKSLINSNIDEQRELNFLDFFTEEEIDFLFERNFIIPKEFDEIKYLKTIYKQYFNGTQLTLLIEPTLRCNFACIYCFEDTVKPLTMNKEHQERLLKFVNSYVKEHNIRSLHVVWFGGEPLLVPGVIDNLTSGFQDIFEENNFDFNKYYKATIVTNGSLISEEIMARFEKWNVFNIQITIDGSERVHNLRRPFKNGKPSFHIVLNNTLRLLKFIDKTGKDIHINLRANFSMDAKDEMTEILDIIPQKYRKFISVHYKHYFQKSSEWGKCNASREIYNNVSLVETQLEQIAFKKGYQTGKFELSLRPYYCQSTTMHYFEITPDLEMYKCNVSIGSRPPIGVIMEDGNPRFNVPELVQWLSINPFEDEECLKCKLLPICMGGCPFARLIGRKGCILDRETYKESVKQILYPIIMKQEVKDERH